MASRTPSNGKKSILVLHWGRSGAGPRLCLELTQALVADGQQRIAVSYVQSGELAQRFGELNIPVLPVETYRTVFGAVAGLARFLRAAISLRIFIRENEVDTVISPMYSLWQSLSLRLAIPKNVKYISTVHDAQQHPGDENMVARFCMELDRRRANTIVTYSETIACDVRQSRQSRVPVVATVHPAFGGDPDGATARLYPHGRRMRVGIFGRMQPYKGVDVLAQSIRILRERGVDVDGLAVGKGLSQSEIDAGTYSPLEISQEWVPEESVNKTVANFDILALPYREASQSGVLAIALAEGVPIVVSPVGALAEQVEESRSGVVADDMTAEAFALALESLLLDKAAYERASKSAVTAARDKFSWRRVSADYRQAIEVASSRGR